jgi:hypothetical protein
MLPGVSVSLQDSALVRLLGDATLPGVLHRAIVWEAQRSPASCTVNGREAQCSQACGTVAWEAR